MRLSTLVLLIVICDSAFALPYLRDFEPAYWFCVESEWSMSVAYNEAVQTANEYMPVDCYAKIQTFDYLHDGVSYSYTVSYYRPIFDSFGKYITTQYVATARGSLHYVIRRDRTWIGWLKGFTWI